MISTFTCGVYFERERFSPEGCKTSYICNLSSDPYPFGIITKGGTVVRWPILYCGDNKWRAQGFEGCGYFISSIKVKELIKKNLIYVKNDQLFDKASKEEAVIDKKHWKGECIRCGRCCMGTNALTRCKYLKEGIE